MRIVDEDFLIELKPFVIIKTNKKTNYRSIKVIKEKFGKRFLAQEPF